MLDVEAEDTPSSLSALFSVVTSGDFGVGDGDGFGADSASFCGFGDAAGSGFAWGSFGTSAFGVGGGVDGVPAGSWAGGER